MGIDDEGRRFDAHGNLRDWWTKEDADEFQRRAKCLIDEYSKLQAVPGTYVNGKLTLGENTAELGGLRLAFMAFMESLDGGKGTDVDGYTPEQRFFPTYAQAWCELQRPQMAMMSVRTDPPARPRFRVDGVVQNMPEFQKAFSCAAGTAMAPAAACRVW